MLKPVIDSKSMRNGMCKETNGSIASRLRHRLGRRILKLGGLFTIILVTVGWLVPALGQPPVAPVATPSELSAPVPVLSGERLATATPSAPTPGKPPASGAPPVPGVLRPFNDVIKDFQVKTGIFTVYQNPEKNQAYLAIAPNQLSQNFLLIATLESGVGEAGLFRGWPVNELLIQFRRIPGNKIQLVVPNVYFRAAANQSRDRQLQSQSFSDSIITTLDITSVHPQQGTLLVDLNDLVLSREPSNLMAQFPGSLSNYSLNREASYLEPIQTFPENVEIAARLTLSGGGTSDPLATLFSFSLDSLPDPRGFNLRLRYSLSQLPNRPQYRPRLADERVGYFITAFRTPVQAGNADSFVRYINRWHLEKQDPYAAISPPKAPIVFWLENTIPKEYRQSIQAGVLLWNAAFERAGFHQALEVRQMPDGADWDPADVRYNVIRWSDSFQSWAAGIGPSRTNPLTGEILDADVILDANVIRSLYQQYQTYAEPLGATTETYLELCGHPLQQLYTQWLLADAQAEAGTAAQSFRPLSALPQGELGDHRDRCAGFAAAQQTAFGGLALAILGDPFTHSSALETYVQQYLKALTAHEVGHVLGLRHNFLGSTLLAPEQLNDITISRQRGLVSSIMDYFPPNLAPAGTPQGDYFPQILGPYDLWAIEYGYKPLPGTLPQMEQRSLESIAQRSSNPELAYATDEDIYDFLDPKAAAWDLSHQPLQYAQWQLDNARTIWEKLDWYSLQPGEGYGQLRRRVDVVFGYYLRQALTVGQYLGGQRFTRTDPWSSRGQRPFEAIPLDQQRQALTLLQRYVFAPDAFEFSPELLNSLAPERWNHWGQRLTVYPLDYPIYNRILFLQSLVLSDMFLSDRLVRMRDSELRTAPEATLTLSELFDTTHQMIWTELLEDSASLTSISSLRRGLQRHHLTILTNLVLRGYSGLENAQSLLDFIGAATTLGAPEDARVLARHHLKQLQTTISQTLQEHGDRLDIITQAHLEDIRDRILKTLDAPLQSG